MTIALRSAHGTAQVKAAASNRAHGIATANVLVGDAALFGIATDNIATVDGVSNTHTTVVDSKGNVWTKIYEYTNTVGGVAADGVTVSLWLCADITTQLVITTDTVTVTFSASTVAKVSGVISYSKAAGMILVNDGVVGAVQDASTNGASTTLSGLPNVPHLFFNVDGFETTQTGFGLTQDVDYSTQWNNGTTGGVNDTNIKLLGAHRIATLTGDTHLATSALTSDSAAILASFVEQAPVTTQAIPVVVGV